MKYLHVFFSVIAFVILSCNGQNSKKTQTIPAETFAKKIDSTPEAQIIDVRTPEEFASDHIENSKNINWLDPSFVTEVQKLDKTKPVFVYCKVGGRSDKAVSKLEELGFTTIYQLEGGIMKWDAAGLSKPSDKIIGISNSDYAKLLNSDKKVLIDFYADWCAPCKKMTPYLLKMQKELGDKVIIIRLNADENKTLISELKIDALPSLLLYEKKSLKWKHSGFISEEDLKKQLQ